MTYTEKDFLTDHKPTWCPGCGNFAIWIALRQALAELGLAPENVLIVYGIGCSGNHANFTKTYVWHSLHGRALPTAIGAKLANHDLTVIAMAGDGDAYGEGLGHFLHGLRGNHNITYIVHDNKVYGLTTGQAAPTSDQGYQAKSTPSGTLELAVNPVALALSQGGTFVARGFSGKAEHLKNLFKEAINHQGFSFVDVFQPCVTFNKINTFSWFFERLYNLDESRDYDQKNLSLAWQKSQEWGQKIPYGIFYRELALSYHQRLPQLKQKTLVKQSNARAIDKLLVEFQ